MTSIPEQDPDVNMPLIDPDLAYVCQDDVDQVLDFYSMKNREDSFVPFNTRVQFIRDKTVECEYCTKFARWKIQYGV